MTGRKHLRIIASVLILTFGSRTFATAQNSQSADPEPAGEFSLLAVPYPDLTQLESAVADQLDRIQSILVAELEDSESDRKDLHELYGELGSAYLAYEIDHAAETCLLNASRLAPKEYRWAYLHAYVIFRNGRLEEAVEGFRRSLEIRPADLAARMHLAEALVELNRTDEAELAIKRALVSHPGSPSATALLGQVALARQEFQTAIELIESVLQRMPQANRLHYPLGLAYRGLGEMEKAREHLAQRGMVGVRPPDPLIDELESLKQGEMVHILRGRRAYRAQHYDEAVQEFLSAVMADPESIRANVNLGTAFAAVDDRTGAIEQFRNVLTIAPDNMAAHYNLGVLFAETSAHESAIVHLNAVLETEPGDVGALIYLGTSQLELRRSEDALANYRTARELDPRQHKAWLGESAALDLLGRQEEARDCLEQAHELMPEAWPISHALARFLAASPRLDLRDGDRAVDLALTAFEAHTSVRYAETVAMALAEVGRCEEATTWQTQAIDAAEQSGYPVLAIRLRRALSTYSGTEPCRFVEPSRGASQNLE